MKKAVFIAGLIVLLANVAYSQGTADVKMAAKISELNKIGIDTIMIYGPTTGGIITYTHFDASPCYVYRNDRFLIWIYQKHNFITLVDECYEYKILKDKIKPVADLLTAHLSEIIHEDIGKPTFKTMQNGKEKLEGLNVSDDMYYQLAFNLKGYTYVKSFGESDLTTEYYDGRRNIYYDQNQQTYLKQVYDSMNKTFPRLKFKKKK